MKSLFHKLNKEILHKETLYGKTGFRFEKADLTEQTKELPNPARGWYQIHTFCADREPDFEELKWCLDKNDTLALLLIDIGRFYDRELDEEALSRIRKLMGFFADAHFDIILRIVYDHEGRGMEREPSSFSLVEKHLEQVGALFKEFEGAVFLFQGMLVGNWGEMHGSRHLTEEKMKKMADILCRMRNKEMYLAVRRPAQWRLLHTYALSITEAPEDGMGLFDDGLFGSESHLGTFGSGDRVTSGWSNAWGTAQEMAFEEELGRYVPNGGEAVYSEDYTKKLTDKEILNTLKKMHITYLNKAHDVRILNIWKNWTYRGNGVWAGKSLYDYIGAHMGYRFLIRNVVLQPISQNLVEVEIEIENIGFAGFYQEGEVFLECVQFDNSQVECKKIDCDIRNWEAGKIQKINSTINLCDCKLYLHAKRKRDGACIRFANLSEKDGRTELGSLQYQEVRK